MTSEGRSEAAGGFPWQVLAAESAQVRRKAQDLEGGDTQSLEAWRADTTQEPVRAKMPRPLGPSVERRLRKASATHRPCSRLRARGLGPGAPGPGETPLDSAGPPLQVHGHSRHLSPGANGQKKKKKGVKRVYFQNVIIPNLGKDLFLSLYIQFSSL